MAILERPDRSIRLPRYAWPTLAALAASGCLVLEQLKWSSSGPSFSHVQHVEVEELECIDCHLGYEDEDEAGYPRLKACMLCHEDFDEEKDPEARADAFFLDGKILAARVAELDPEIKFSHLAHVTDEDGCLDCHETVVKTDEVRSWMGVSMQDCVDCHQTSGEANSCDACHEELREDVAPRTHDGNWDKFHGQSVRNHSDLTVEQCDMCHKESACISCHQEQMPTNHNNFWRRRGHGLTAQLDRENCSACHTTDYCDSCHTTAQPQTHTGLFGGARNTHCFSCHLTAEEQSCSLCHQDGAPSHALAPLQPPGHNPASDCRECHIILSHVDNGTNCNTCHN